MTTPLQTMGHGTTILNISRWIQSDTIIPDPANPQSLNRYSYVLNNPLRYVDPTGHWWEDPETGALLPNAPRPILEFYGPDWDLNADTEAGRDEVWDWFGSNPGYDPAGDSVARNPEAYGVRYSPSVSHVRQYWDECQRYVASDRPFRDAFFLESSVETGTALLSAAGRAAEIMAWGSAYAGVRSQGHNKNQQALMDLVKEALVRPRRRQAPLSVLEAITLVDWAREYGLSVDVGESHILDGHWQPLGQAVPHIHIGGRHVPVVPSYRPE